MLSEADTKYLLETPGDNTTNTDDSVRSANVKDGDKKPFYKTTWFIGLVALASAVILPLITFFILTQCRTKRSNIRTKLAFRSAMTGVGAHASLRDFVVSQSKVDHCFEPSYDSRMYQYNSYSEGTYAESRYNYDGHCI